SVDSGYMPQIFGDTSGLHPRAKQTLERIQRRRVPLDAITTPELVRSLAEASAETHRQVGALVHRSGSVEWVVVGSATALMLPDIGRLRAAQGRFRALRLVHTHLYGEPLTKDDLVDLTRLRLDLVCAVLLTPAFEPRAITWAHNVPNGSYDVTGPVPWGRPMPNFGELITALEAEYAGQRGAQEVQRERAILLHVADKRGPGALAAARQSLRELHSLARTAGVLVSDEIVQLRDRIDAKLVLGKGKLEEVV